MDVSFLDHVKASVPDPLFGIMEEFKGDLRPHKVNLSVGIYQDEKAKTPPLKIVKKVEKLLDQREETKEYLPIDGDPHFIHQIGLLLFGEFFWLSEGKRIVGIQTPGGTGALRVGGEFLQEIVGSKLLISDPTWPNHRGVFTGCRMVVETYPYYDVQKREVAFDRLYSHLSAVEAGSTVILHACCHNPTGLDLTNKQWELLSTLFKKNGLFPFFDCAYQGFGQGLEQDVYAIRLFAQQGHEMAVASSQSKNFGLYAERTGALYIVTHSLQSAERVRSKLKVLIRMLYSNPPKHGAAIVREILMQPASKTEWEQELFLMRQRLLEMRRLLAEKLHSCIRNKDFSFLEKSQGMFGFTGLNKEEVLKLKEKFGVYMSHDGRINISGLNRENISYIVEAIYQVL